MKMDFDVQHLRKIFICDLVKTDAQQVLYHMHSHLTILKNKNLKEELQDFLHALSCATVFSAPS